MLRRYSVFTPSKKTSQIVLRQRLDVPVRNLNLSQLPRFKIEFLPEPISKPIHSGRYYAADRVLARIDELYEVNPFVKVILNGAEQLIDTGQLSIFRQTQDEIAKNTSLCGTIAYFERYANTGSIYLEHYPTKNYPVHYDNTLCRFLWGKAGYISKGSIEDYAGSVLHEATHAVDYLLAGTIPSACERKLLNSSTRFDQPSDLLKLLEFKFKNNSLNGLNEALRSDLLNLITKITSPTKDNRQQRKHVELYKYMFLILRKYQPAAFLIELKAYMVQLTAIDRYGHAFIQENLPNTSRWFLNDFKKQAEHKYIRP